MYWRAHISVIMNMYWRVHISEMCSRMFGFLCRLADNSKFLAVLHCMGISNINGFKCNCGLWLAFCADLLTTASTEWTFQTYISTNTWWAMWGCPCSLIDNIMHCNVVSNIHNYKEPMSYVRNSLQILAALVPRPPSALVPRPPSAHINIMASKGLPNSQPRYSLHHLVACLEIYSGNILLSDGDC